MALLPPGWPILVVVDETLERRKGARIAAKGMYRDAVRSSKRRVVTCLGLPPRVRRADPRPAIAGRGWHDDRGCVGGSVTGCWCR